MEVQIDNDPSSRLDPKIKEAIDSIYNDSIMAQILERQNEFYLMDSAI